MIIITMRINNNNDNVHNHHVTTNKYDTAM